MFYYISFISRYPDGITTFWQNPNLPATGRTGNNFCFCTSKHEVQHIHGTSDQTHYWNYEMACNKYCQNYVNFIMLKISAVCIWERKYKMVIVLLGGKPQDSYHTIGLHIWLSRQLCKGFVWKESLGKSRCNKRNVRCKNGN